MKTLREKLVHYFIIGIFVSLYFLVATISMINSVAFFDLSHAGLMSWSLAIGFEIGAAASLAAIIILDKTNKTMVWGLFLLLTSFQMMANSYHAFVNLEDYMGWIELFGLQEEELIFQKRVLAIISGAILPLVALGFIKSLVDYIRPEETESQPPLPPTTPFDSNDYMDEKEIQDILEDDKFEEWDEDHALDKVLNSMVEDLDETDLEIEKAESELQEIISEASEEAPEKDLYSRDAEKAKPPVEVGEVHIAPETVQTDNADVDDAVKPVPTEHITPVGDPIIIPTTEATPVREPKPKLTARKFQKGGAQN